MKAAGGKRQKALPSFVQPADSKIFRERFAADLAATAIFEEGRRAGALQHGIYRLLLGKNKGEKHLQKAKVGVELWKLEEVARPRCPRMCGKVRRRGHFMSKSESQPHSQSNTRTGTSQS